MAVTAHSAPTDRPGVVIGGKYKLIEEIGEGGMGQVFMAQQMEPVKRAVAVKVQYPGIAQSVRSDLKNLRMFAPTVKGLFPGIDLPSIIDEIEERVLEELDYEHEASNQRMMARTYRGHPFIRIPAGGLLAAAAAAPVGPDFAVASGILGAGLAASTHATKAGGRLLINTSPEPFSNWGASLGEDALVIAAMWLAVYHPWLFIGAAALFLLLLAWLLPKLWRGVRMLLARIARLFGAGAPPARDGRL